MATTATATVGGNNLPDTMEMAPVPASSSASSPPASGSELRRRVTGVPGDDLFGRSDPSSLFDATPAASSSADRPQTMVMTGKAYKQLKADLAAAANAQAQEEAQEAKAKEIAQIQTRSAQALQAEKNSLHCEDLGWGCCLGAVLGIYFGAIAAGNNGPR